MSIVDVYIAEMPEKTDIFPLHCQQRTEEISACANEKVKKEKYCVWKLLEYAIKQTFRLNADQVKFEKTRGKWTTPHFCFSLSHSGDMVAVAVSDSSVGVDIERFSGKMFQIKDKYLTEKEKMEYEQCKDEESQTFLLKKWTQKESIFKATDEVRFCPNRIETNEYITLIKQIVKKNTTYMLSVATDFPENVRFFDVTEYLD